MSGPTGAVSTAAAETTTAEAAYSGCIGCSRLTAVATTTATAPSIAETTIWRAIGGTIGSAIGPTVVVADTSAAVPVVDDEDSLGDEQGKSNEPSEVSNSSVCTK